MNKQKLQSKTKRHAAEEPERIQKVLAQQGLASRRTIEEWIQQQRIRVNGRLAQCGDRIVLSDTVTVDGKRIPLGGANQPRSRVLLFHKPVGTHCSHRVDPDEDSIYEWLPRLRVGKWISVGRLDVNTAGLLLLTTDGELANRLMHPSYEVEREYAVRLVGKLTPDQQEQLLEGLSLEDGLARFDRLTDAGGRGMNHWYHAVLHEGRNREVRRLFQAVNKTVNRLIRIRYGDFQLPRDLPQGKTRELSSAQVKQLRLSLGLR